MKDIFIQNVPMHLISYFALDNSSIRPKQNQIFKQIIKVSQFIQKSSRNAVINTVINIKI